MRTIRYLAAFTAALAVVACTATTPGWTYAPAPSVTPAPSSAGSALPGASGAASSSPAGSAPASAPASAAASAAASGATGGTVLQISAQNVAYDTAALTAPAGQPFQIHFTNKDAGTPHNVAIHQGSPTGAEVFKGEIFPGPGDKTYDVPALAAGTYGFVCSVHANMTGTLTVQ